jgi:hypothetical protein
MINPIEDFVVVASASSPRLRRHQIWVGGVRVIRVTPAGHVDRDRRAAALHERQPVLAVGRVAVAVDDGSSLAGTRR